MKMQVRMLYWPKICERFLDDPGRILIMLFSRVRSGVLNVVASCGVRCRTYPQQDEVTFWLPV